MRLHPKLIVFVALLSFASSGGTLAQSQPAPVTAWSSESAATHSFEVATIKPNTSGSGDSSTNFGGSDRFTATNVTVKNLMQYSAFHIAGARIVGGPKWLDSAHFDIEAKLNSPDANQLNSLPFAARKPLVEALVQNLLTDRFGLKTHWDEREQPVYALVVAKGGSKLQQAAGDTSHGSGDSTGRGRLRGTDVTISQVAELLAEAAENELGRVIVDRTGIEGVFDINLKWAPQASTASSDAPAGPSLFTAIQEQLGLKLEAAKAPVRVLVIDRLEMPSEN